MQARAAGGTLGAQTMYKNNVALPLICSVFALTSACGSSGSPAVDASVTAGDGAGQDGTSVDTPPAGPVAVVWVSPASTITALCARGTTSATCVADGDADGTNGWQGSLSVRVTVDGMAATSGTVSFASGATMLGMANIDAMGNATLTIATPGVTEGAAIVITATTSNIDGRGTGTASKTLIVDVNAPAAPVVTATVKDRRGTSFTLSWPAPADQGGSGLAGYDVRVQKITDCMKFDMAMGKTIALPGMPAQSGLQSLDATGLIIENNYCFGAQTRDGAGNVSAVGVTAMPAIAKFNISTLAPPTAAGNEQFGLWTDGSADINGNPALPLTDESRLSDLLVGSFSGNRAFIYFGASGGNATFPATPTPNVTISRSDMTLLGFGGAVAHLGNFDGDAASPPEIAVAAYGSGKVFVFKGRTVWPATLDERNADWVIQADAAIDPQYTGSFFGYTIARLGNFDGDADGTDDFAISAFIYGPAMPTADSRKGRVIIVKGKRDMRTPGQSVVTINVPEATPDRTITLSEPLAGERTGFGGAMVGLGRYYADGPGTTLVVSATGLGSPISTSDNKGRIYAFRMQADGMVTLGPGATSPLEGAAKGDKIGSTLTNLGVLSGTLPNLGIGSPTASVTVGGATFTGAAYLCNGSATTAPWANRTTLYSSATVNPSQVIFGGGMSGSMTTMSLFGDATPEVAVSGAFANGFLYIVSGTAAMAATSPANLETSAEVKLALPRPWAGTASTGGLLRDINGDGIPDFAVADALTSTTPGKIAVFW